MSSLRRNLFLIATAGLACGLGAHSHRAASAAPTATAGKQVYDRWCASCHEDSLRAPGTTALAAKYGKDLPAPLEQRQNLTPELIRFFVRNGVSIMPSFRKTEISDAELAALGQYLGTDNTARRHRAKPR